MWTRKTDRSHRPIHAPDSTRQSWFDLSKLKGLGKEKGKAVSFGEAGKFRSKFQSMEVIPMVEARTRVFGKFGYSF